MDKFDEGRQNIGHVPHRQDDLRRVVKVALQAAEVFGDGCEPGLVDNDGLVAVAVIVLDDPSDDAGNDLRSRARVVRLRHDDG